MAISISGTMTGAEIASQLSKAFDKSVDTEFTGDVVFQEDVTINKNLVVTEKKIYDDNNVEIINFNDSDNLKIYDIPVLTMNNVYDNLGVIEIIKTNVSTAVTTIRIIQTLNSIDTTYNFPYSSPYLPFYYLGNSTLKYKVSLRSGTFPGTTLVGTEQTINSLSGGIKTTITIS